MHLQNTHNMYLVCIFSHSLSYLNSYSCSQSYSYSYCSQAHQIVLETRQNMWQHLQYTCMQVLIRMYECTYVCDGLQCFVSLGVTTFCYVAASTSEGNRSYTPPGDKKSKFLTRQTNLSYFKRTTHTPNKKSPDRRDPDIFS